METYAKSPPTSSLVLDEKGNLYIASINGRAIGRIDPKSRDYHVLTRDIRLLRPDNLTFGRDGALHFDTPTRIRGNATPTTSTTSADTTSFSLFRLQPLAPGRAGD